jgi:hypothetical protein
MNFKAIEKDLRRLKNDLRALELRFRRLRKNWRCPRRNFRRLKNSLRRLKLVWRALGKVWTGLGNHFRRHATPERHCAASQRCLATHPRRFGSCESLPAMHDRPLGIPLVFFVRYGNWTDSYPFRPSLHEFGIIVHGDSYAQQQ